MSMAATDNTAQLLGNLNQPDSSIGKIIARLGSMKLELRPEDIINNALRLEPGDGIHLLRLLDGDNLPIEPSNLSVHIDKIADPEFKVLLLRYLGTTGHEAIPSIVVKFLADQNKLVVVEALKALDRHSAPFDASVLLPYFEAMSGIELQLAQKVFASQANTAIVPRLSPYLNTNSLELNEFFARIIVHNADKQSLETFLRRLMLEDDYSRQQAIALIYKIARGKLAAVASELAHHKQEFIRDSALQLSHYVFDDGDLDKIEEFALSDNWQVRGRALQSLAKSSNRRALDILKKQAEDYPDDLVPILRAVRQLGFSKGLEIAFMALNSEQANVQRAALETIEVITNEKHAANVRNELLKSFPLLTDEMREFAKMLIAQIAQEFRLPDIQLEASTHSRFGDIDLQLFGQSADPGNQVQNISLDALAPGELWMERYRIEREIGRGAMGRVMQVEDEMVEESLILKFMLTELTVDEDSIARFKREVKYSRRVSHRNVIRVHDILLKDRVCAISMEYFESRGLQHLIKERGSFETREGLQVLHQIASGMAAAHEEGVIHRDLKPSNILINDRLQVKIVDFGIAYACTVSESTLTRTGTILGSPAYLSPERAEGAGADERSDIYSLGIIAYLIFSGRLPYIGKPMEVLKMHRKGNARPVAEIKDGASAEVSALIEQMMVVDPGARLQTMAEVEERTSGLLAQ